MLTKSEVQFEVPYINKLVDIVKVKATTLIDNDFDTGPCIWFTHQTKTDYIHVLIK